VQFQNIFRKAVCLALVLTSPLSSGDENTFAWPNGAKAAVSLAYDDALGSQLDIAIPALDKYGFKGSFYVPVDRSMLTERLAEWQAAAKGGHELGNHSMFHQCDASLPGREWVPPHQDLRKASVQQMHDQVMVSSKMLYAIDGKRERTYTAPCGDLEAADGNYINAIKDEFIAIKLVGKGVTPHMIGLDPHAVGVTAPTAVTGKQLIAIVEEAAARGTMANITFHGVGGDYLSVSQEAHEELLAHLAKHPNVYWVDTFISIMKYVKSKQSPH
jgi:peptidoglycan/xylan/chitin deacetylase (PgdA/CDA1 family)